MPWSQNVAVVLQAGNTIINPSGMFSYSPSPGAGNLVSSVGVPSTVTADQFGNALQPGITNYFNTGSFWVALSIFDGALTWYEAASEAGPWTLESSIGFTFSGGLGGLVLSCPLGISGSFTLPITGPSTTSLPNDTNSGSTWVSGERAFMNNNWVTNINSNEANIIAQLFAANVFK